MPSEKQLLEILDKDTVDTSRWTVDNPKEAKYLMEVAEGKIYSVAIPQADGTLRAWHVTDDPQKVVDLLKDKGDFYAREGDLCGGLYVSAVPHFWEGRSNRKWEFLPKLSREARGTLYQSIYDRLVDQIKSGYITQSEFDRASDIIAQAMTSDYWQILDIVANQPFNIDIPRMAKTLALATPFEPQQVPVDFVGRYLEFNTKRSIEANEALLLLRHGSLEGLTRLDLCNMLKSYGWDGVFTKASMGTNPELVIWSGDKVVRFGDYAPGASMGSSKLDDWDDKAIWIPGERFQALIHPNKKFVLIHDTLMKGVFRDLTIDQVFEMQRMMREILGPPRTSKRFETRRLYNIPQIYDRSSKSYFRGMGDKDISDLNKLLTEVLKVMVP